MSGAIRALAIAASVATLGALASAVSAQDVNAAGYLLMPQLLVQNAGGRTIVLSGTLVDGCKTGLPNGSALQFAFDGKPFAAAAITALERGSQQSFKVSGRLPTVPALPNNTTALDFTVLLPSSPADPKTSPCRPTLAYGTPP